jgi:hypothetical protein
MGVYCTVAHPFQRNSVYFTPMYNVHVHCTYCIMYMVWYMVSPYPPPPPPIIVFCAATSHQFLPSLALPSRGGGGGRGGWGSSNSDEGTYISNL